MTNLIVKQENISYITNSTGVLVDSTGLIVGLDCMQITTGESLKVS